MAIWVLVGAMAAGQMGLATNIITSAFVILLGSAAVAFGIAFGLGGREIAAREIDRWLKEVSGQKP